MTDERMNAPAAEAKAAKARATALRPWYKRKRVWALAFIAVFVIAAAAEYETRKESGNPPQDDVTIVGCEAHHASGFYSATVQVTNSTSKRSDYHFQVAFESATGAQLGTAATYVNNLEPGHTAVEVMHVSETAEGFDWECRVTDVVRHSSGGRGP